MTFASACSHQVHLRHDHVGAGHPGPVGRAPGHGVEHGDDDEDAVALRHADRGSRLLGHGVQPDGTVRVDDALRAAGRPTRVTHGRGGALVEVGPREAGLLGRQQPLVGERLAEGRGVPLPDHDDRLDGLQFVLDACQQRNEGGVDDDAAVLGVVDDIGQLLGRQPDVQRVQDRSHAGDGEVGLEVALVVPAEGADAVTRLDAEPGQGGGQPLGPGGHLDETGLAAAALLHRDDGAVAVYPLPVEQQVSDQERGVLHGALHAPSMASAPRPCLTGRVATVEPHGCRLVLAPDARRHSDAGRVRRAVGVLGPAVALRCPFVLRTLLPHDWSCASRRSASALRHSSPKSSESWSFFFIARGKREASSPLQDSVERTTVP